MRLRNSQIWACTFIQVCSISLIWQLLSIKLCLQDLLLNKKEGRIFKIYLFFCSKLPLDMQNKYWIYITRLLFSVFLQRRAITFWSNLSHIKSFIRNLSSTLLFFYLKQQHKIERKREMFIYLSFCWANLIYNISLFRTLLPSIFYIFASRK